MMYGSLIVPSASSNGAVEAAARIQMVRVCSFSGLANDSGQHAISGVRRRSRWAIRGTLDALRMARMLHALADWIECIEHERDQPGQNE